MALTGKVETEVEVHSPAAKFFNFFITQLHDLHNNTDVIHGAKLHQGDWHSIGSDSIKQWTYTVDGKVQTCKEHIEEIDHEKKSITFNLFDGDIGEQYKSLKEKLQVIDEGDGTALAKWTYEYEKLHEGIPSPEPYLDLITKVTTDVDARLTKA
ncbi:MLP-like protein 43 [Prosopis cineraria]|uniref:MLP-like protein 43 n=1 Tax=Prosopis cineraria TaxID=364024 RepID=UPI00240F9AC4|nr:MLP-like protein 43 [Prosopis cineraria]XP_054819196.1 MLP-like protein 43 [Prosopis cineraria]